MSPHDGRTVIACAKGRKTHRGLCCNSPRAASSASSMCLHFSDWAVPPVASPAQAVVVVWNLFHLDEPVAAPVRDRGHALCLFGGDVRVGETQRHCPSAKSSKQEDADNSLCASSLGACRGVGSILHRPRPRRGLMAGPRP